MWARAGGASAGSRGPQKGRTEVKKERKKERVKRKKKIRPGCLREPWPACPRFPQTHPRTRASRAEEKPAASPGRLLGFRLGATHRSAATANPVGRDAHFPSEESEEESQEELEPRAAVASPPPCPGGPRGPPRQGRGRLALKAGRRRTTAAPGRPPRARPPPRPPPPPAAVGRLLRSAGTGNVRQTPTARRGRPHSFARAPPPPGPRRGGRRHEATRRALPCWSGDSPAGGDLTQQDLGSVGPSERSHRDGTT